MSAAEAPWYRDGLAFECTRCGACCTGAPGYVWVGVEEMKRLATHLAMTLDDFGRKYVRSVQDAYSLIERPNGDCIFWEASKGCTVYSARPDQCRTWPFWPENIESPSHWERVGDGCPGAGRGRVYSVEEIVSIVGTTST
jgi:hypothetical protein